MAIEDIYRRYFQKSKIFIYPLLGIKRGSSVTPIQTYISWKEHYTPEDMKLIATYYERDDSEFLNFKKNILLKHVRLCDFISLNDECSVYVFDFSDKEKDWSHFLNGKYSKISKPIKNSILNYYDPNTGNYVYVDSYLNPEKYFKIYADVLLAEEDLLRNVGELASLPDLEKEKLTETVKVLNMNEILD